MNLLRSSRAVSVRIETAHHGVMELPVDRSARRKRTLAIVMKKDGPCLQVPLRMRQGTIDQFVIDQRAWIIKSLQQIEKKNRQRTLPENSLPYLGRHYPIRILHSALLRKKGFCEMQDDAFHIHLPDGMTAEKEATVKEQAIRQWYAGRAVEIFKDRTAIYAAQMNVRCRSIKVTDPKSRWGSCDRFGNLNLSWRVIMSPMALVDYLIVHELAHILRFDHSPAYWRIVEGVLPDYKARRKALRDAENLRGI